MSDKRSWYVVYTKASQEKVACENLLRQGYVVYLPRIKVVKRIRGLVQVLLEPLFPRYVFVQPASAEQSLAPVRSTMGVSNIVRFGQEPALMNADTLQDIRNFEIHRNALRDSDISPFQPGERVQVTGGPLSGLEGLISSVSQQRIVVLLQLLGQDTRVNLSRHQLVVAH
jgi:transcriptional antiterminator RfaH